MVFDATRKVWLATVKHHYHPTQVTYKNLSTWYTELRQYRPAIPTLLAANKIDENMEVCVNTNLIQCGFFNWSSPISAPKGKLPITAAVSENPVTRPWLAAWQFSFWYWNWGRPVKKKNTLYEFNIKTNCEQVTTKSFAFAGKNDLPLYYVSAADGTNVVKMFRCQSIIWLIISHFKRNASTFQFWRAKLLSL